MLTDKRSTLPAGGAERIAAARQTSEPAMTPRSETKSKPAPVEVNPYQFWVARFWHGMLFGSWMRLLARNGFRISPTRLPLATTITCGTIFNSLLRPVQDMCYGRYIEKTQIKDAPIFILGHWRSGTTLLHELLVLDQRVYVSHDVRMPGPEPFFD